MVANATSTLNVFTEVQSTDNDHGKRHCNDSGHSDAIGIVAAADASAPKIYPSSSTIVTGTANFVNNVDLNLSDDSIEEEPNEHIAGTLATIDVPAPFTDTIFANRNISKNSIQNHTPKIKEKKYHVNVADDARLLYTCKECDRSSYRLDKLELHIKDVHDGIRDHLCDHCGKLYATSNELQQHIRSHTGENT